MAEKISTAEEFAAASPVAPDAVFDASVVSDLDEVPAEFLDHVRARFEARFGERYGRRSR
ncbi:MAG: hypothetical protein AAGA99_17395 [Actinomycetota bacterium]